MLRGRSHGMRAKLMETSFFKLMSKDYHGEVAKFSELVLNSGKKLTGLESRNDLMHNCSRSEVRLVQPERFGESHVMNSGIWRVSKLCWCLGS